MKRSRFDRNNLGLNCRYQIQSLRESANENASSSDRIGEFASNSNTKTDTKRTRESRKLDLPVYKTGKQKRGKSDSSDEIFRIRRRRRRRIGWFRIFENRLIGKKNLCGWRRLLTWRRRGKRRIDRQRRASQTVASGFLLWLLICSDDTRKREREKRNVALLLHFSPFILVKIVVLTLLFKSKRTTFKDHSH